jgi:hypothetical protein
MMATFGKHSYSSIQRANGRAHDFVKTLILAAVLCTFTAASTSSADVSGQVSVTHSGFGRNRANGIWTATLTVKNTSGAAIGGPVQVVLTKLPSNVTMVNNTGMRNADPYVTVSAGTLAPGTSVNVTIQFTNPSNGFIDFTPVTYSGG